MSLISSLSNLGLGYSIAIALGSYSPPTYASTAAVETTGLGRPPLRESSVFMGFECDG